MLIGLTVVSTLPNYSNVKFWGDFNELANKTEREWPEKVGRPDECSVQKPRKESISRSKEELTGLNSAIKLNEEEKQPRSIVTELLETSRIKVLVGWWV